MRTFDKIEYSKYLTKRFFEFGYHKMLLLPVLAGIYFSLKNIYISKFKKLYILLILILLFLYTITVLISGKCFIYHWLPFLFFSSILTSLIFTDGEMGKGRSLVMSIIIILTIFIWANDINLFKPFFNRFTGKVLDRHYQIAEKLFDYIKNNSDKKDLIQPLDHTDGALHALLKAERKIATPYLYDYYFYHHVSNEYVKKMKHNFITTLNKTKPRFIIKVNYAYIPQGIDTSRRFEELEIYLNSFYFIDIKNEDYRVYKRKEK